MKCSNHAVFVTVVTAIFSIKKIFLCSTSQNNLKANLYSFPPQAM